MAVPGQTPSSERRQGVAAGGVVATEKQSRGRCVDDEELARLRSRYRTLAFVIQKPALCETNEAVSSNEFAGGHVTVARDGSHIRVRQLPQSPGATGNDTGIGP